MKKFIVIYHAPDEAVKQMGDTSAEEMQKGMEPWMKWAEKCGSQLVDMGTPLIGGQKMFPDGNSENSKRNVCGYSILEAENMEEAKSLIEGHPHLMWRGDCEIEIHESMPLPG